MQRIADLLHESLLWHCISDPTLEIWTNHPYHIALPLDISATVAGSILTVNYATEGAMITVVQRNDNGALTLLGRGTVKGRAAQGHKAGIRT
jgi:hypothetical protein